ncbi:MAG: hypothetical protein IIY54_10800, partial [Ruminococcus sp.]|nr:hypothetical protein [Ruminococcus sp.]
MNGAEKCIVCILGKRLKSVVRITSVFIAALKCHRIAIIHAARSAWNIKKRMERNTAGGRKMSKANEYKSRVYTDRPEYADLEAPAKFDAIQGIIATRLRQHPKAICSYSGGADSDIWIDLIERT